MFLFLSGEYFSAGNDTIPNITTCPSRTTEASNKSANANGDFHFGVIIGRIFYALSLFEMRSCFGRGNRWFVDQNM
jgi:hypothetical protein